MIQAGVNVVRINFSHGSTDEHRARVEKVRELSKHYGVSVGILADLQGPKIRIERFIDEHLYEYYTLYIFHWRLYLDIYFLPRTKETKFSEVHYE